MYARVARREGAGAAARRAGDEALNAVERYEVGAELRR
jgi:hypothetical protein